MPWVSALLNVDALVGTFNQEKTLVGAFSLILKTDGLFAALRYAYIYITQIRAERREDEERVELGEQKLLP